MNIQKAAAVVIKIKQAQSVPVMADAIQHSMTPDQRTTFATKSLGAFNNAKDIKAPPMFNNIIGRSVVNNKLRGMLGGIRDNDANTLSGLSDPSNQQQLQSVFDVNPSLLQDTQKIFKDTIAPSIDKPLINNAMKPVQDFTHNVDLAKTASIVNALSNGFKAVNPFKHSKPAPIPAFGGEPSKPTSAPVAQQPIQQEHPQSLSAHSRRNIMSGLPAYQPQQEPVVTSDSFDHVRAADVLTRNVPVVENTPNNVNIVHTPLGDIDKRNMPEAVSNIMPDEISAQGASWKLPDSNTTFNAEPMKNGIGASLAFNNKF